jgi:hypothetical protein
MNGHLQNSEGLAAKHLLATGNFSKQINAAGMAELVDARDLKFPAPAAIAQFSCKTFNSGPAVSGMNPAHLQNIQRWKR